MTGEVDVWFWLKCTVEWNIELKAEEVVAARLCFTYQEGLYKYRRVFGMDMWIGSLMEKKVLGYVIGT